MKRFKRLLSVLLAVVMACTTLCVTSFADDDYVVSVTIDGVTTNYTDISEAFSQLGSGVEATITLLEDVSTSKKLTLTGTVTFDLGGHSITSTYANSYGCVAVTDSGTVVTIKNGSITGSHNYGVLYAERGTLTLEELEVTNTKTGTSSYAYAALYLDAQYAPKIYATDCTFTSSSTGTSNATISAKPKSSTTSCGSYAVSLTNCTVTSAYHCLWIVGQSASTWTIDGSTLTSTSTKADALHITGQTTSKKVRANITINDSVISAYNAINGANTYINTNSTITISGDSTKISGNLNAGSVLSYATLTATGGNYSDSTIKTAGSSSDYEYVPEGYYVKDETDGTYTICLISEITVEGEHGSATVTVDDEEASEAYTSQTVVVTPGEPDAGYKVTGVTVTGDVSEDEYTVTANADGTYSFTMPAEDVTVTVEFALVDYTVTIAECTNGSASIYGSSTTANMGDFVDIITSPNTGYEVDSVTAAGASGTAVTVIKTALNGYRFTMPAKNVTVTVTFKLVDYTVSLGEIENGEASLSSETANMGDTVTVTPDPADDYEVMAVTVDSNALVVVNENADGTYSFTMPANNVTVNVTFKMIDHDVTTTTTSNGTYSTDVSTANTGDTVTITTSPDTGYEVDAVTVTGAVSGDTVTVTPGSSGTYTFTMPSEQVSISVTYKMTDYEVAVIETANGEVSVPSDTANYGDTVTIIATPEAGYKVGTVTVNGDEISGLTFTMPAEDVEVEVTFVLDDLGLVTEAVTGGTVDVSESLATAQLGDTVTFTVSASAGYTVAGATVTYVDASGETQTVTVTDNGDGTYSFIMPAYAVSITPSYNAIIYTTSETESVTVDYGYYTVSSTTATVGQTVYIYTYPDTVYRVSSITVVDENGNTYTPSLVSSGVYSFTMPASNVAISVIYEQYAPNVTGMIYVNEQYHGYFIDGHLVCIEHTVDENGYCTVCREYIGLAAEETDEEVEVAETEIIEETIEIEEPVEDTDTEIEVDETEDLEASDPDTEPETNPTTGLSLALLPMAIAVAGAVASKRK